MRLVACSPGAEPTSSLAGELANKFAKSAVNQTYGIICKVGSGVVHGVDVATTTPTKNPIKFDNLMGSCIFRRLKASVISSNNVLN
jgi:hypothetical protein